MAKKKQEQPNNVGRPTKYDPAYNVQVLKLAILGATDKQIADFFDVAESTLNLWKLNEPDFSESIKKGKMEADMNVASSLYQKAIGYKAKTQKAFKVRTTKNGEGSTEDVKVVTVEESHPPDTTAAIFWLKNRKSDVWRDKQEIELPGTTILNIGSGIKPPDETTD
jgi:hypothetical protein